MKIENLYLDLPEVKPGEGPLPHEPPQFHIWQKFNTEWCRRFPLSEAEWEKPSESKRNAEPFTM